MHATTNVITRLLRDESGATMVEYSIMAALIAGVCVIIVTTLGGQTQALFNTVSAAWAAA